LADHGDLISAAISSFPIAGAIEPKDHVGTLRSQIGQPVRYYKEGWRHGTLLSVGKSATVQHPVKGRAVVPIDNVELEPSK